jgi:hypothetical protein
MGRPPCCDKANVKKGPWTPEEDAKLLAYTSTHGTGNWTNVPQRAGDRAAVHHAYILLFCLWLMTRRYAGGRCGMM